MNHRFQYELVSTSYSFTIVFSQWVGKCWKNHQQTSKCPLDLKKAERVFLEGFIF